MEPNKLDYASPPKPPQVGCWVDGVKILFALFLFLLAAWVVLRNLVGDH